MTRPRNIREHLADPAFLDHSNEPLWFQRTSRLRLFGRDLDGKWESVAREVESRVNQGQVYFPDANVAILDQSEPFWTQLRLSAMQTRAETAYLSVPVYSELINWLKNPYRNASRAEAIYTTMQRDVGWIGLYDLESACSDVFEVIYYYVRLLGVRRTLALPAEGNTTPVGIDAEAKADVMNAIKDSIGPRAVRLAKKGRDDKEKTGSIKINDEAHCLLVIAFALLSGTSSIIVTADYDLVEVFYKAQWFIDTHYRAWLAGMAIERGQLGVPLMTWTDPRGYYFRGPVHLYRRPPDMARMLPEKWRPVSVHVMYVPYQGNAEEWTFVFEREMVEMLLTKYATNGRCTDKFGENNIHIDLGPVPLDTREDVFAVGTDVSHALEHTSMVVSHLDATHALNCRERHGHAGHR